MAPTRKQKAREKRSRQSDVIENLDVMLGNFRGRNQVGDENMSDADFDLESRRQQGETNLVEGNFRSVLNTNVSENREITAETSRAINSEMLSMLSTLRLKKR